MSHINTVAVSGRATRDPEYLEMPSGNNLAKFGIAVERSWLNKDTQERVSKTSFFDINVWGPFANVIAAKVRKGDALVVQGSLEQETWIDKETNGNRSRVLINAIQVDGEALFRKADGSDTPPREITQPEQHAQQPLTPPTQQSQPQTGVGSSAGVASDGGDGIPF